VAGCVRIAVIILDNKTSDTFSIHDTDECPSITTQVEGNIKVDLKDMIRENVGCIRIFESRVQVTKL
jgi:hypothetical protein